jgi:hypothetical protein
VIYLRGRYQVSENESLVLAEPVNMTIEPSSWTQEPDKVYLYRGTMRVVKTGAGTQTRSPYTLRIWDNGSKVGRLTYPLDNIDDSEAPYIDGVRGIDFGVTGLVPPMAEPLEHAVQVTAAHCGRAEGVVILVNLYIDDGDISG